MSLNFEGVTRIVMAGRPVVKVPAGMTVEATLAALQYKVEDYEASVSGETLTLALPSGSKGALPDVRVLESGRLVPLGNSTFPTVLILISSQRHLSLKKITFWKHW